MVGQLSLFDYFKEYSPIEGVALQGTGFVDGKKRVLALFQREKSPVERAKGLSKEYGIGGCCGGFKYFHGYMCDGKGIKVYDLQRKQTSYSWSEFEKIVADLIARGVYADAE